MLDESLSSSDGIGPRSFRLSTRRLSSGLSVPASAELSGSPRVGVRDVVERDFVKVVDGELSDRGAEPSPGLTVGRRQMRKALVASPRAMPARTWA
jgi:hypothetical protein